MDPTASLADPQLPTTPSAIFLPSALGLTVQGLTEIISVGGPTKFHQIQLPCPLRPLSPHLLRLKSGAAVMTHIRDNLKRYYHHRTKLPGYLITDYRN